jgi:hypothetical protein
MCIFWCAYYAWWAFPKQHTACCGVSAMIRKVAILGCHRILPKSRVPGEDKYTKVGNYQRVGRLAWVANRSWSCKRVGMQGRGGGQWLARIIDWAIYQGSMDGKVRSVVQKGVDLLWVQVTTSESVRKYLDTPYSGKELRTWQERSQSKL